MSQMLRAWTVSPAFRKRYGVSRNMYDRKAENGAGERERERGVMERREKMEQCKQKYLVFLARVDRKGFADHGSCLRVAHHCFLILLCLFNDARDPVAFGLKL